MMNRQFRLVPAIVAVVAVGACSQPAEEAGEHAEEVARGQDFEISTTSEEARVDFDEGMYLADVGRNQEANEKFEAAIEKDPAFAYAYLWVAFTAASGEEFAANINRAMEHIESVGEGERLMIELGRTFIDNDAEKRLQLAEQLVELYPHSPRAWLSRAAAQQNQNDHEGARGSATRAMELDPHMIAAHSTLGFSYLFNDPKDFEAARAHMEHWIEISPGEAKAHEGLGDAFRGAGDLENARSAYSKALETDPSLSVAALKKGHINSFLGNIQEARADYDTGVEGAKAENRGLYANYKAFTHVHAGDPAAALYELGSIVTAADGMGLSEDKVNGVKIFTLSNMALIALHSGMTTEAERVITDLSAVMRAEAERVDDAEYVRATEAAIALWEGRLAARKGDFETARSKAEQNQSLLESDRNPRKLEGYHGLIGLIGLLQGSFSEAIQSYNEADLTNIWFKFHMARAAEGAGNMEMARALYADVAAFNFNSVAYALVRKEAIEKSS